MKPIFLIGILASNHKAKTLRCLESLRDSAYRNFNVLLVDNGSTEAIGEAARGFDFVSVSIQGGNTGCAGGRNLILDYFEHEGDWPCLLFLDNDAIVTPHALETLAQHAEAFCLGDRKVGALGPHVVYMDKPEILWCAGGAAIDWTRCWFTGSGQGRPVGDPAFQMSRRLDTLTGGFMMASREAILATGHFVDDYFIYVEDTDWCWRMNLAGYELLSVPEAIIIHDASSSVGSCTPRFHYYRIRNRLWFFQAFSPLGRAHVLRTVFRSVFRDVVRMELLSGRGMAAMGAVRGLLHGIHVPRRIHEHAVFRKTADSCIGEEAH